MKKSVIVIIILLLVIGGAGYALIRKDTKIVPETTATPAASTPTATETAPVTETVITYSEDGFNPANLTVKVGNTVTVKNTSSQSMQLESDPHPTHTKGSKLNAGVIAAGESDTFTVYKIGTFGYHNHLNPNQTGTIIVE